MSGRTSDLGDKVTDVMKALANITPKGSLGFAMVKECLEVFAAPATP